LPVAVYALHAAKGFAWLWNLGGYEYPIFWGLVCVVVAMNGFRQSNAPS
jgi:putative oxidoreductase